MSASSAGPACPRCGRRIAAWRLEHCIYCGAVFPPDLKEGFAEPEALKWVERPTIPPDAARQLEMLKVVPLEKEKKPRQLLFLVFLLSLPIFAVIFYLLYSLVTGFSPALALAILAAGVIFIGYLVWIFWRGTKG